MDADGKNPRALTTEKDAYVRSAAWTPGRQLPGRPQGGRQARRHPARRALDLPPRGRRRHQADVLGRRQQRRRGRSPRGTAAASTSRRAAHASATRPNLAGRPLADLSLRPRASPRRFPVTEGFGGAVRPRALARRQDARVRAPARRRHRARRCATSRPAPSDPRARRHARRAGGLRAGATSGPATPSRPTARRSSSANHGKLARLDLASGAQSQEIPFTASVEQCGRAARDLAGEASTSGPFDARILRWPSQSPDGQRDRVRRASGASGCRRSAAASRRERRAA